MLFLSALWVLFILPDVVAIPTSNPYTYNEVVNLNETLSEDTSEPITIENTLVKLEEENCTILEMTNYNLSLVNANITHSEYMHLALKKKFTFIYNFENTSFLLVKDNDEWFAWRPSDK
jgi:hypothetical protein